MYDLYLMPRALSNIEWWKKNDLLLLKLIYGVLEQICKAPYSGKRQPEPLTSAYSGYWSRIINSTHRIVYKVENNRIIVHSLYEHYQGENINSVT